jgi:uncharacterized protein (DUF1684 family)
MRVDRAELAVDVANSHAFGVRDALDLLDWKRRIFALYEQVRSTADPKAAWRLWRDVREELYRTHPQSPLPGDRRERYGGAFFDYDPAYRVLAEVVDASPSPSPLPASTGGTFAFSRVGSVRFELLAEQHDLELHWNEGYGGGILLAVADETSGTETYGGGRYVIDTVKGADLGDGAGRIVVDFNFAYNPSCAFDSRWSCPLAPVANRLPLALPVGERAPG